MEIKNGQTIGEVYGHACQITDADEARQFLGDLVALITEGGGHSEPEAERIALQNIGYYAGYYGRETRQRVERFFGAKHPIFESSNPTPSEAFAAGLRPAPAERAS